jgi:hypothetical protein
VLVDDARVSQRSAREAFRRAVVAHRRAIATHERAALLHDRYGRSELAAQQRTGATLERERLAAAELLHPEWL